MRVSVCIPTVNRLGYLKEAVRSVASQTFREYEIVIADNSADSVYNGQVRKLVAEFPNVTFRVFHHRKRITMVENCNFLVDCAEGEYWIYFPDDDRMCPDFLASLVPLLDKHAAAGFAFSDHWIINADGTINRDLSETNSRRYHRSGMRTGFIPQAELFSLALHQAFELQSMLLRRDVVRALKFDPSSEAPDLDFQLRLTDSDQGIKGYYCAERLTEYRVHGEQATVSGNPERLLTSVIGSLERCHNVSVKDLPLYRRKLAGYYLSLSLFESGVGRRSLAAAHLRKSVSLSPTFIKAYLGFPMLLMPKAAVLGAQSLVRRLRR